AVNVVRTAIVGDERSPEVAHVGMKKTLRAGLAPVQVHFCHLVETWHGTAPGVLTGAEHFHTAFFRFRQERLKNVEITVVWGAGLVQDGFPVKIRMRRRVIAAVKRFGVRFLHTVVRKRLTGDLASSQATTVSEGRQKKSIYCALFLENIQRLIDTFIHKRNGANL